MRIAHIILSRGFAGSERATAELCNAQSRTHDVLLIIRRGHANAAGITIRQWVDPGVRIVEVGNWLPRAGISREPFYIYSGNARLSERLLQQGGTGVDLGWSDGRKQELRAGWHQSSRSGCSRTIRSYSG